MKQSSNNRLIDFVLKENIAEVPLLFWTAKQAESIVQEAKNQLHSTAFSNSAVHNTDNFVCDFFYKPISRMFKKPDNEK